MPINPGLNDTSKLEGNQEDQIDQIGEVQEEPTQYTLLGRLKDIWDRLIDGTQITKIADSLGSIWELESNGAMPINIQDQHSEVIDLYMCRVNAETNPSGTCPIDTKTIAVNSATGAVVGECIDICENGRCFQAIVTGIDTLNISFNAPTDQVFTALAAVKFGTWNMNVDGSSTTVIFKLSPPEGAKWDITRILIGITDDVAMDATTFGGITSLTNGVVLRSKNGITKNIFIVNNNGGFGERAYDIAYDDRRQPQSEFGFRCRRTFAGQNKNGVTIRLDGDTGDSLQFLIQDNLEALSKLAVNVQGHEVTN